jgi:hypothetical protein
VSEGGGGLKGNCIRLVQEHRFLGEPVSPFSSLVVEFEESQSSFDLNNGIY